jgi:phospholipid transport system transporter-binding protein
MIARDGDKLLLSGSIGFEDALEWRDAVLAQLDRDGLVIDLGCITEADSTALSLLLEWRREAQARGMGVAYANLPAAVHSLAAVYGIEQLIPVVGAPAGQGR